MERSTIIERMNSGYKKYRADGGKVGRKNGYKKNNDMIREEYADVFRLLKKGLSLRNIAKLTRRCVKMHAFFFMHKSPTFTSWGFVII